MSFSLTQRIALLAILVSVFALASAFFAQYVIGLEPCKLCIWQRWPFAAVILTGLFTLFTKRFFSVAMLMLTGFIFLVNGAIAFFHSGVERLWWEGLKGCSAPDLSGSVEDLMARIQSSNGARCDEIPWADPIIGLSMANYNVILCLGMGVICLYVSLKTYRAN